ncbi:MULTISPECIES: peptidoglycan-binding domain-containing protein [Streptomyces]|uniref:Peptidoglycan binding-like domain-containing protein n=1 Tax=Streptomyces virginiae TaxID=1961 RepID=A0ABQ3NVX3_STRVG|nr:MULTISPECIES: peptidoglycan-binding domain-containing protein [Streptomyces]KOU19728.1 hypothetical protein ADK49_10470 [Streptomyces sp. WM6349]KOU86934.1 hypothetical protein ADK94_12400 [Streptomyces sp. XY593]KOV00154.1 hypothetical protein ADK92_11280 [Streptomyces sp. XY533]KOV11943.1 hypothetical protein ADK91_09705 [Streptomyces sp. XY511]KOV45746.1 hypothetical protein ADK98_14685 [Streptomyces sp. H036]
MKRMQRTLAHLTAVAALATSLAGIGTTSAQAAMPACNDSTVYIDRAGFYTHVPTQVNMGSNFCTLRKGADNNAVYDLQQTLWYCYGGYLVTDGKFGPATETLLKKAQAQAGIPADGVYGPQTRDAIKFRFWQWETGTWRCLKLTDAPQPLTASTN